MDLSRRIANLTPEQRAQLEARLRKRSDPPADQADRIERCAGSDPCPLSYSQERLWFLEQLDGPSATYNLYSVTRLRGPLAVNFLETALAEIVNRHESLRTTFPADPGEPPRQLVGPPGGFSMERQEIAVRPGGSVDDSINAWSNEFVRRPMVLAQGPLFRVALLRVGPDDHVLAVLMHHIISDGWSLEVFFRELRALYAGCQAGDMPALPQLPIQYADYARWQRQHLQGPELQRHVDYWRNRLGAKAPVMELPSDFPRPSEQSYRGASCVRQLSPKLTESIRQFTRKVGVTMFMTSLAVFKAQLYRYTGQPNIIVGCPVTNRSRVELEPLIGFFVNMLVLRSDFSGDPTITELIDRVRSLSLDAMAHQVMPFESLVRELQPDRSLSYSPLFQVAFMFEESAPSVPALANVRDEPISVDTGTAKFDLTLFVRDLPTGLVLGLEYSLDLFTRESAERMLGHLESLFGSFVVDSSLRISELNLLPLTERQALLVDWNKTQVDWRPESATATVHGLVAEQVRRSPAAVAVQFGSNQATFQELDRRVSAVAAELRRRGVCPGALVGVFINRSIQMVVGMLGILTAGAAYVPLDPAFPKDRLGFMVADAQIGFILTENALVPELPPNRADIICVDAVEANPTGVVEPPAPAANDGNGLAYVIYTSGSTGRPKGVQIPHNAVVNFLLSMRRAPGLNPDDVLLAITTLSFDIAGLELLLPLIVGARVVIAPREIAIDGGRLAELMESTGTTVMQGTPSTWRLLIESGWRGRPQLKILCGGEPLPPELAHELVPRCAELWNMYGPTETTIWSTCAHLAAGSGIHIGRPIANTDVYLLDGRLNPVPIGVVGELFIGGDGLARGYLNRPELTEERFIAHPFKPGQRLYRTGDLARYRSDGSIVCLGRIDSQLKIRGYRVEPGEIESVLAQHRSIAQAVVAVLTGRPGGDQLAAYIVPRGEMPAPAELREHLRTSLPDYMVPSTYVRMDRLPLTPNGKIDRKALPSPTDDTAVAVSHVAPRNATEAVIAAVWAKVLGLKQVSVTDDFFSLGGHSLLAVRLFGEIERSLGCKLPLATLFKVATVEGLAREISAHDGASVVAWSSLVAIRPDGIRPVIFCVHGAGGNVLLYRDLAAKLGNEYPIYGFQSRGLDGRSRPLTTVEEMAEHYLAELRTAQPRGPYYLAGYCLGGMVAYQMARLLRQAGEEIALVAMMDAYNPVVAGHVSRAGVLWQRAKFHAANLVTLRPWQIGRYLREKLRVAMDGELQNLLGAGRNKSDADRDASDSKVQLTNDRAVEMFRPLPYEGAVTLFKPQVNYNYLSDPKMGWGSLVTGELSVVELPVNPHAMLVEPFVEHLAKALQQRLSVNGVSRPE